MPSTAFSSTPTVALPCLTFEEYCAEYEPTWLAMLDPVELSKIALEWVEKARAVAIVYGCAALNAAFPALVWALVGRMSL